MLRNVGPTIAYKLRDAAGQAREYHNYMLPVEPSTASGCSCSACANARRSRSATCAFRPTNRTAIDGLVRMRAALADPDLRAQAVDRYVARAADPSRPAMAEQLHGTATRALALFAGAERAKADAVSAGGWQAIADFMEANVPEADRERACEVLLRILNGVLFDLLNLSREQRRPGRAAAPTRRRRPS